MLRKLFQFITVCKGDINHRKPKTAKITSAEFGAVSSCVKFLLPLQGEPFRILVKLKHGDSLDTCLQQPN